MDSDCLICMGAHHFKDCNPRKKQHCSDCHMNIRNYSDHSSVCSNKNWIHDVYSDLYVRVPLQRCNIGFNCDVRFYMNEMWRKSTEGVDAFSPATGMLFRFVTDRDLRVLSNSFVHGSILVIVKDIDGTFKQKLVLMTSKKKMMLTIAINQPFDPTNAKQFELDTSLILVVSGDRDPAISISLFPINGQARHHEIRFDSATQAFNIPDELKIDTAMPVSAVTQ